MSELPLEVRLYNDPTSSRGRIPQAAPQPTRDTYGFMGQAPLRSPNSLEEIRDPDEVKSEEEEKPS